MDWTRKRDLNDRETAPGLPESCREIDRSFPSGKLRSIRLTQAAASTVSTGLATANSSRSPPAEITTAAPSPI